MQARSDGEIVAGALGMHDAAAGRHEVHGAGLNQLPIAQAVAMHDLAFEQIRDRREPDVRMRAHGDAVARRKHGGPHVIEKHERPDHAPLRRRQHAANVELAEAAHARLDRQLDRRGARARLVAHGLSSTLVLMARHNGTWLACRRCSSRTARRCSPSSTARRAGSSRSSARACRRRRPSSCFRRTTIPRRRRSRPRRGPRRSTISAGFPTSSIGLRYPAPGSPELARDIARGSSGRRLAGACSRPTAASIMAPGFRCR